MKSSKEAIFCCTAALILLLSISINCYGAPPSLSNSEASTLIEAELNKGIITIPLGEYKLLPNDPPDNLLWSSKTRTISPAFYKRLLIFKEAGLIVISEENTSNAQLTNSKLVSITLTIAGKELAIKEDDISSRIRPSERKVSSIVKNEARQRAAFDYRIVMATLSDKATPAGRQVIEKLTRSKFLENFKIIALFKHDPFSSSWNLIKWDMASIDSDFETHSVADELNKLGF